MLDAVFDTIVHNVGHKFVRAEGGGDQPIDIRMSLCGIGHEAGDVCFPVVSGEEEKRLTNDRCGALPDACVEGIGDGGRGEFHVCRLDDGIGLSFSEK